MSSNHIYIIRAGKFYKIGRATDLNNRMETLRTGCPLEIIPVGFYSVQNAVQLELFLHYKLQKYQVRNEWFDLPANILKTIKKELDNLKSSCDCSAYCTEDTSLEEDLKEFAQNDLKVEPSLISRENIEGISLSKTDETRNYMGSKDK